MHWVMGMPVVRMGPLPNYPSRISSSASVGDLSALQEGELEQADKAKRVQGAVSSIKSSPGQAHAGTEYLGKRAVSGSKILDR